MTHVSRANEFGLENKDIIHNIDDKSIEGYFKEEESYQIDNFITVDEVEFLKKFYYDRQTTEVGTLADRHFLLIYPLNYPEVSAILKPKITSLFGEWYSYKNINDDKQKQSSDFFFLWKNIFAPHVDSIIHIPGYIPYKDVIIPLEMHNDVDAPYYTFHQRWYGRGTHFKKDKLDNMYTLYSDIIRENKYYDYPFFKNYEYNPDKMVSYEWYEEWFSDYYPYSMLEGFSLDKMFPWTPGSAIVTDSTQIHGATNYHNKGGKYKLGITLRIFKHVPEYDPSPIFSTLPQLQGFSECKYDARLD